MNRQRLVVVSKVLLIAFSAAGTLIIISFAYLLSKFQPRLAASIVFVATSPAGMLVSYLVRSNSLESFTLNCTSFIIVFPLCSYCLTALTRFYSKIAESSHYSSFCNLEFCSDFTIRHALKNVTALDRSIEWLTNAITYRLSPCFTVADKAAISGGWFPGLRAGCPQYSQIMSWYRGITKTSRLRLSDIS